MPSPFPGMNPYFEQPDAWSEFHDHICFAIKHILEPKLGDGYFVKVDQNIYGVEGDTRSLELLGRGDTFISRGEGAGSGPVAVASPAPATMFFSEELSEEEAFLEIRDRKSREVLTVIELLSPTNKRPGPKREQFLAKRRGLIVSNAHYIEIDLLRGFPRLPARGLPVCDYYVAVSRTEDRPKVELWPLGLREPLPTIPVPVRTGVVEVSLDLQAALHRVYDLGAYQKYIYDSEPEPPLTEPDVVWARSIIESKA